MNPGNVELTCSNIACPYQGTFDVVDKKRDVVKCPKCGARRQVGDMAKLLDSIKGGNK